MTDSTVTAKQSLKPDHMTMEEWVESRIARFEGRKYDWNALKFQADFDPKYRRAQMRYIGTGATGVASDTNTVPAEHFTFSTMVLPSSRSTCPAWMAERMASSLALYPATTWLC